MTQIYTKTQFETIKMRCPRNIYPKHCKDGTISYMVRITNMIGDKRTLITTKDIREAMQVLTDYKDKLQILTKTAPLPIDDVLAVMTEVCIPTRIMNYLDSLPPHEILAEENIYAQDEDGEFAISPALQSEYLRRMMDIPATPLEQMIDKTESQMAALERAQEEANNEFSEQDELEEQRRLGLED